MTDATPVLAAVATAALLLGGGIAMAAPFGDRIDDELSPSAQAEADPTSDSSSEEPEGEMTVEESERTHEGADATTAPPFYASRIITLEGTLTLAELPVDLDTTNGDIQVDVETGDGYALVANLTGYGATPDQARENRDEMSFEWDAGQPGDRHLVGHVEHGNENDGGPVTLNADRKEAHLSLTVPEDVELGLVADTTNGQIDVTDLQASSLLLDSTNGEIAVTGTQASVVEIDTTNAPIDVEVTGTVQVLLDSTNGAIEAEITPAESGGIEADSTNGDLDILVPETDDHGYQATATTTNGRAEITLEDGDTQSSDGGDHVVFETDGFASRSIQTTILASTTNGGAHVGPLQGGSAPPVGSSATLPVSR